MPDPAAPETPRPKPDNPASLARLWARYKKARGARVGLWLVAIFTLTAFLAPFLAHRLPLFWKQDAGVDAATGAAVPAATSWPLVREFFAPSDTTEPMLERGINFLLLFIPAALLAWRLMDKHMPRLRKTESRLISLLFGAMVAAALWLSIGGMVVDAGGKDWLHFEKPPVPDIDDIEHLAALKAGPGPIAQAVGARLQEQGATPDAPPASPADADARSRELVLRLQTAIEGPPIMPVAEGRSAGVPTYGIAGDTLSVGINSARWNRLLIEAAYPGLLVPMRQFRTTFVTMVVASALALAGLSYIFLAGAWQFSLSPRWLILLALALVLSLPFRLPARINQTPYRQLAAEGKGWGVFPLIPYGPNENAFGPRLPPTWYVEAPLLTTEAVRSWDRLAETLERPATPQVEAIRDQLARALPDWQARARDDAGKKEIVAALNAMLSGNELGEEAVAPPLRGDPNISPFLSALRSGKELSALQTQRLGRLLLEKNLPGVFVPVTASHWKKPRDTAGYHLLGTDESGRDVLVRIIHGARVSLSVGFVSVFLATVIGLVLGALAGYYGGRVDMLISRFMEIMMCFPSFFLILAVIAVLDRRSIVNIMLVIGLTSWTGVARLIRGEMLRQRKMDYVSASIALGASDTRTIFRHILPNAMAPVLVSISFGITGAILTEASLSFIGFGVTPPTPTWGQLLSETRDSPLANWWLAVFPGIVLFLSVLAYNMVGEAVRDALDPRTT